MAKPKKTTGDGTEITVNPNTVVVTQPASGGVAATTTTELVGIGSLGDQIPATQLFGQFDASAEAKVPHAAAVMQGQFGNDKPAAGDASTATAGATDESNAGNAAVEGGQHVAQPAEAQVQPEAGVVEAVIAQPEPVVAAIAVAGVELAGDVGEDQSTTSDDKSTVGTVVTTTFVPSPPSAPIEQASPDRDTAHSPYRGIIEEHELADAKAAVAHSDQHGSVIINVEEIASTVFAELNGLTPSASLEVRSRTLASFHNLNSLVSRIEGGNVELRQFSLASCVGYYAASGETEDDRNTKIAEDIDRLKLDQVKSKSKTANAVVAALNIKVKTDDKDTTKANRRRVDRDALASDATFDAMLEQASAGNLNLLDATAVTMASRHYIKANGGVVAVAETERKRRADLKKGGQEFAGIDPIPLNPAVYADHRSALVKSRLAGSASGFELTFGIGRVQSDGTPVEFQAISIDTKLQQRLLDTMVVASANVQFMAEVLTLTGAINEAKTDELLNRADDKDDPDAPRKETRRQIIVTPDQTFVVTAYNRDAGIILVAMPHEAVIQQPILGDLIMLRVGYQNLAVNLIKQDRRAAFTVWSNVNRNRNQAQIDDNPLVIGLSTKVAIVEGKDAKVGQSATRIAQLRRADRSDTRTLKVVDDNLVVAHLTATINSLTFKDAAERLPNIGGKRPGDRVAMTVFGDGTLMLAAGDGKIPVGCAVTVGAGTNNRIEVDRQDLLNVVGLIAQQVLVGPVTVEIDTTGLVKFGFATNVGRFAYLVPTLGRDGRSNRHFIPFTPTPWVAGDAQAAD